MGFIAVFLFTTVSNWYRELWNFTGIALFYYIFGNGLAGKITVTLVYVKAISCKYIRKRKTVQYSVCSVWQRCS